MNHSPAAPAALADTRYAETYFRELSPAWLDYVAVINGARPRDLSRPFTYLELGCGSGQSSMVHAAAFSHAQFHACDLMSGHIQDATAEAEACGIRNIRFHEADFASLGTLRLPRFDFIVAHGVYSWVGPQARAALRQVASELLEPGGLLYVSYNCQPGWAAEVPLRRLLLELARTRSGTAGERGTQAAQQLRLLSEGRLRYFTAHPEAAAAVESYMRSAPGYLAHEFLSEDWEPFYSVDVADEMRDAELTYIGSATLCDNHPLLVVDEQAATAIAQLQSPRERQLALDFAANRRFRRDVFIRGQHERVDPESAPHVGQVIIGCAQPERMTQQVRVPRGQISFQSDFIREVQAVMRHGAMPLSEIVAALGAHGRSSAYLVRNLLMLVAAGTLQPFATACRFALETRPTRFTSAILERMVEQLIARQVQRALPSPIAGNGLEVQPLEALVIRELIKGGADSIESLTHQVSTVQQAIAPHVQTADPLSGVVAETLRSALPQWVRLRLID